MGGASFSLAEPEAFYLQGSGGGEIDGAGANQQARSLTGKEGKKERGSLLSRGVRAPRLSRPTRRPCAFLSSVALS